jgi:hypothetical protein
LHANGGLGSRQSDGGGTDAAAFRRRNEGAQQPCLQISHISIPYIIIMIISIP